MRVALASLAPSLTGVGHGPRDVLVTEPFCVSWANLARA